MLMYFAPTLDDLSDLQVQARPRSKMILPDYERAVRLNSGTAKAPRKRKKKARKRFSRKQCGGAKFLCCRPVLMTTYTEIQLDSADEECDISNLIDSSIYYSEAGPCPF